MCNGFKLDADKRGFTVRYDFYAFEVRMDGIEEDDCKDFDSYAEAVDFARESVLAGQWDRIELFGLSENNDDYEYVSLHTWKCPAVRADRMKFFVYGTLKRNEGNNRFFQNESSQFIGPAQTVSTDYVLLDLGPYPAAVPAQLVGAVGTVLHGELFEADARVRRSLDRLEGYPNGYNRKEFTVLVDGVEHTAWMYFMERDRFSSRTEYPICEGGAWVGRNNRPPVASVAPESPA